LAAQAKILLLDEPMAGVNTEDVPLLTELIGRLHSEGRTVLMVEHHMAVVVGLAQKSPCSITDDSSRAVHPMRSWPTRRRPSGVPRRAVVTNAIEINGPARHHRRLARPPGRQPHRAFGGRDGSSRAQRRRKDDDVTSDLGLVASSGQIKVLGHEVASWPTHRIVRLGIGYVPEDRDVFSGLTVEQNLRLAESGAVAEYDEVFSLFPELKQRGRQRAGTLSGGQQQMLSIARALLNNGRFCSWTSLPRDSPRKLLVSLLGSRTRGGTFDGAAR
jgi:ABC-type lipoprotein export system ATPase subunit